MSARQEHVVQEMKRFNLLVKWWGALELLFFEMTAMSRTTIVMQLGVRASWR